MNYIILLNLNNIFVFYVEQTVMFKISSYVCIGLKLFIRIISEYFSVYK